MKIFCDVLVSTMDEGAEMLIILEKQKDICTLFNNVLRGGNI